MNEIACFAPDAAAEVLAAPADDPRRLHAERCPRCGALLEAYAAFMKAEAPAGAADWGGLERTLRARIDATLDAGTPGTPGATRAAPSAPVRRSRPDWLERLLHPAMRPALAFAALAAVAAGVLLVTREAGPPGVVLRGEDARFEVESAGPDGGALRLRWHRVPGAETYRIQIYSTDLREIGVRETGADTVARVAAGEFSGLTGGDTLLVRIEALADGDVVRSTPLRALRAP